MFGFDKIVIVRAFVTVIAITIVVSAAYIAIYNIATMVRNDEFKCMIKQCDSNLTAGYYDGKCICWRLNK